MFEPCKTCFYKKDAGEMVEPCFLCLLGCDMFGFKRRKFYCWTDGKMSAKQVDEEDEKARQRTSEIWESPEGQSVIKKIVELVKKQRSVNFF